jgi:hypothetical protein
LLVTISDPSGLSVTSAVTVTVSPVATSIAVSPHSVTVAPGGRQQFSATALDQFGHALAQQPACTWTLSSPGLGTLSASGLFTAGVRASGSGTVQASAGGVTGTATLTVATSTVVFRDNFAYGAGNWTVTSGQGEFYLINDNGNDPRLLVRDSGFVLSRVVAGQLSWANYSYQATLNIHSGFGSAGLLARVQDNTHLYYFGCNIALGEWMIAVANSSAVSILASSVPFALRVNQDYTVRADLRGSSLKLYVNGVLQAAATDPTCTHGRIGFSATRATALLDDVVVTLENARQRRRLPPI